MTRFETPGQIVLLLAGAAVISVILIALLNVEAKNRKIKGRGPSVSAHCPKLQTDPQVYTPRLSSGKFRKSRLL
jgi:hypothetical protein